MRWERAVQDAEDKLESARQAESNQKAEIENDETQMEKLKSQRTAKKMEVDSKDEEIGKCRREVGGITKDIQAAQKQLNSVENKIEQRKAERHNILMNCKVCTFLKKKVEFSILFQKSEFLNFILIIYRWKTLQFQCFMETWKILQVKQLMIQTMMRMLVHNNNMSGKVELQLIIHRFRII